MKTFLHDTARLSHTTPGWVEKLKKKGVGEGGAGVSNGSDWLQDAAICLFCVLLSIVYSSWSCAGHSSPARLQPSPPKTSVWLSPCLWQPI